MAGAKGRSGGARPGAGRKPKNVDPSVPIYAGDCDMLTLLKDVALGRIESTPLQVRAAIAAVQYTHTKCADGGKKEERHSAAKEASAGGRFAPSAPPKLVVSNK